MKYAWFTVGLPEYSPQEAVQALKANGYQGIEWRVVADAGDTTKPGFWAGNRCTLQESWSDAQFREIAKMTRDTGLQVPNMGAYARVRETTRVKRMIEIAAVLGSPSLRVNVSAYDGKQDYNEIFEADTEAYAKVIEMAGPYKIKPLIEIHMNTIIPSASAAIRFLTSFEPEKVGVIHDAGNMVYEGFENYQAGLEMLGEYLAHVHLKNAMPLSEPANGPQKLKWKTMAAPLRKGMADLNALLTAFKKSGYDGWLSFEDFSMEAPLVEKVRDNIAFLKDIEKGIK
jgi:sugar phosphate isomerase/epimerase